MVTAILLIASAPAGALKGLSWERGWPHVVCGPGSAPNAFVVGGQV